MTLSKINVRSPFYLLADPNTTTTTTSTTTSTTTVAPGPTTTVAPTTAPPTTFPPTTQPPSCTPGGITLTQAISDASVNYGSTYVLNTALHFTSSGNLSYTVTTLPSDQNLVSISQIAGYISFTTNTSGNCGNVKISVTASDDINSCTVSDNFTLTVANCPTTTSTTTTTQPDLSAISINSLLVQAVGENPTYQITWTYTTLINNVPVVKTSVHTLPLPTTGAYNFSRNVSSIYNVTASVTRTSPDNTVADLTTIIFYRNAATTEQSLSFNTGAVVSGESYTFTGVNDNDALYVRIDEG